MKNTLKNLKRKVVNKIKVNYHKTLVLTLILTNIFNNQYIVNAEKTSIDSIDTNNKEVVSFLDEVVLNEENDQKEEKFNAKPFNISGNIIGIKYKEGEINVPYDKYNDLHQERIRILSNPNEIYKGVNLFTASQYRKMKEVSKEIIIEHLKDINSHLLHDEEFLDNLETGVYGVSYMFNEEKEIDLESDYNDYGYAGLKLAIDLLDHRELKVIKGSNIIYTGKIMRKRSNPSIYVDGYAAKDFSTGLRDIIMGVPYFEYRSNTGVREFYFKKNIERITLHEIGHLINYELETMDDFWDKIKTDADKDIKNYNDRSSMTERRENFTENFVQVKIQEGAELLSMNKSTPHPYSEDFKTNYNNLLNKFLMFKY